MSVRNSFIIIALGFVAACDRSEPTRPGDEPVTEATQQSPESDSPQERAAMERLARRVALSLADPDFREYVRSELERSPVIEHKLQLQRFLSASNGKASKLIARVTGESEASLTSDASTAGALEMYFPVPEHRAAWTGGPDLLVASAREDRDAPVAYDIEGRRQLLSPDEPPSTPVLAIVPVETDFGPDETVAFALPVPEPSAPPPPPPPPPAGLFMTYSHFVQDFEGWLKG